MVANAFIEGRILVSADLEDTLNKIAHPRNVALFKKG
jgi:hypothetical protein